MIDLILAFVCGLAVGEIATVLIIAFCVMGDDAR